MVLRGFEVQKSHFSLQRLKTNTQKIHCIKGNWEEGMQFDLDAATIMRRANWGRVS